MPTKNETLVVEMHKAKETKGTWMYAGAEGDPITNIYFQKSDLEKIGNAEKIKVTIEKTG